MLDLNTLSTWVLIRDTTEGQRKQTPLPAFRIMPVGANLRSVIRLFSSRARAPGIISESRLSERLKETM